MSIYNEILDLKKKKNALILAHYYQNKEIQDIADYVGDSYYLSRISKESKNKFIVFCGVDFMGESAKILSPDKKVLLANRNATCPMANMLNVEEVLRLKETYEEVAVVTYINSSLKLKTISDVIVTSSNAESIIKKLPEKNIIFIPDKNLGSYLAEKISDKHFILLDGYCPVHEHIDISEVKSIKEKFNNIKIVCHPECDKKIRDLSEFIGSTSEIISYVSNLEESEVLVLTENGVDVSFKDKNYYYKLKKDIVCANMKKTTLENIRDVLLYEKNEVKIDKDLMEKAKKPLIRMHELA